jgi:hypothetical protein
MFLDILKKDSPEKAAARMAKAEAGMREALAESKAVRQKQRDSVVTEWVDENGDEFLNWTPPPALKKEAETARNRLFAARSVLSAARENYAAALKREADRKEAERQTKIRAGKVAVVKRGKSVDEAINNLVAAVLALRLAEAEASANCPPEIIDHFARANLALWPVLNRKLKRAVGNFPGVYDNAVLNDAALSTFVQHLPGVEK